VICAGQCCQGVCCNGVCCTGGAYCNGGQCSSVPPPNPDCTCPPSQPVCLSTPINPSFRTCLSNSEWEACVACVTAWAACRAACGGSGLGALCSMACDGAYTPCIEGISGDLDPNVAQTVCIQVP
jgi:hypothetical protein